MKKTTSLKLTKKLSKYGAMAAAIGGVADASGQITYTDVMPDFAGGANSEFLLDLDNDGTNDFRIYNVNSSYTSYSGYTSITNNLYIDPLTASNDVLGSGGSNFAYPFALSNGAVISSGSTSWRNNGFSGGFQSLNYGSCSYESNWCDVTDGYLGLRFNIAGSGIHYGWARLDVDADGDVWSVKDFAYNNTVGASIVAGQQTLSVGTATLNDIRIVGLNKTIGLYNLNEATSYNLFDMSGKRILNGTTSGESFVIEANTVTSGVYIIELKDPNSNKVVRKKLIL